jgi:Tfp pilus assembly protein PilF
MALYRPEKRRNSAAILRPWCIVTVSQGTGAAHPIHMSLKRFSIPLLLFLSACAVEPGYNRYELPAADSQPGDSAVAQLQESARQALERHDYQQAIEYLQRAIKIEPRNPYSWHYLGETYWQSGDYQRCAEMVERSFSYSEADDELDILNRRLRTLCLSG